MLTVHQLSKSFNLTTLFENVSFSVNRGERVGIIGPNGCGKTTLMQIIAGQLPPSNGSLSHATGLRIGYLPQGFELDPNKTVAETIEGAIGNIDVLESELAEIAIALSEQPDDTALQAAYDSVLAKLVAGSDGRDSAEIFTALSINSLDQTLPVKRLSGGQKTRLALALMLLDDPQILLLDEPTNHLDIAMLEWLEDWLASFAGGVLLISHDRTFLDQTVTKIIELNRETKTATQYAGNYTAYIARWNQQRNKQISEYKAQTYEIRRLRQDANRERARADKIHRTTTARQPGLRKKAKKAMSRAKSKEARLERYEADEARVDKVKQGWQLDVDFSNTRHLGRSVLDLDNLEVGYTNSLPLIQINQLSLQSGQRVVLTGPNGSGKSTLLKTIAGQLPPLNGRLQLGSSVRLGYMSQEQELLDLSKSPTELLLATEMGTETDVRNYLHHYLFSGDEATKACHLLSFGQRARLELALLVAQGCNFLLLDEPINHLDIPSRELFEQALTQFKGATLAVIHDRYFIGRFASEIWWVQSGTIAVELLA